MTEDEEEGFDERLKALIEASEADEESTWPALSGVKLEDRRRVWCLVTALEIAQNPGGRPAVDTARDAILAASMFDDWISESKVPRRPSIVREETP